MTPNDEFLKPNVTTLDIKTCLIVNIRQAKETMKSMYKTDKQKDEAKAVHYTLNRILKSYFKTIILEA